MDKNNIKKEYTNGEITIVWQSGKCIHSGNCVKNNADVFRPKESPWIKADASPTQAIIDAIDKCPSGALSYRFNHAPETEIENYNNLVDAIVGLKQQGYTIDFNLKSNCIVCSDGIYTLMADEFHIDKYFRFDGDTNPEEESIIYAISSSKHGIKGILINGYGTSSEAITDEMIAKLK
jgi:uncharacterized Fe-S cluster protein YjdI